MATVDQIRTALEGVMDPELHRNLVELGMIRDIALDGGSVTVTLALTTIACPLKDQIAADVKNTVAALDGVDSVEVELTEMTPEEKQRIGVGAAPEREGTAAGHNNVRHIIAVMSGKGGVGKSLVSGLLALALRRQGHQVGILDADITGPSIPKMFLPDGAHLEPGPAGPTPPHTRTGIRIMSINLLLESEDTAVIWRGPLISGAIKQFWGDIVWGTLDYLIVDLPPGTSDASLTVMQSLPISGVVLVTSPQGPGARREHELL
jgi:ATP-binding protein involved in chromosome partitioning